ncbi:MAG: LptF/LptG family permease, partial [Candidatus Omnitrophica bacterium]|nr:LptF/LptG family permease [Candidatus Omnitrophota bacterium]
PDKNTVKLKLIDGTSDEPDPQAPTNFYKLNFKNYFMSLNLANTQDTNKMEKKTKEMTIKELNAEIKKLKSENIDPSPLVTEINEKISLAFSCFVFMLIGTALALVTRRREKSINIGISILIITIYYPLLIGCEALGMQGVIRPAIALWIPNILFGVTGTILLTKVCAS